MSGFNREAIREAVLAGTQVESVLVPYGEQTIELRTPSLADLAAYRAQAGSLTPGDQNPNMLAEMLIRNCYVPETSGAAHVFEETDVEVIMSLAWSKDMKRLVAALNKMLGDDDSLQEGVTNDTKSPKA